MNRNIIQPQYLTHLNLNDTFNEHKLYLQVKLMLYEEKKKVRKSYDP